MTTAKHRKTITLKLNRTFDADLIEWWEGLPKGDYTGETDSRQHQLKKLLRYTLQLPNPTPPKELSPSQVVNYEGVTQEQFERLQNYTYEQLQLVAQYINELTHRMESFTTAPQFDQTPMDTTPRASEEQLQQRKANRKKNQW